MNNTIFETRLLQVLASLMRRLPRWKHVVSEAAALIIIRKAVRDRIKFIMRALASGKNAASVAALHLLLAVNHVGLSAVNEVRSTFDFTHKALQELAYW